MTTDSYTGSGQPARPYSTPDQLGGNAPRSPEFQTGLQGAPESAATVTSQPADAGLTSASLQFQRQIPQGITQTSVLQPNRPSMNAQSAQDYERVLPGGAVLPSVNGTSEGTYQQAVYMRLRGQDEI